MPKIQITLDATKLRNLVNKREYQNRDGQTVQLQEVKFELVEVKERKEIYKKDNMRIIKTHFAAVIQTKEERQSKAQIVCIGEGFTTVWGSDKAPEAPTQTQQTNTEEEKDLLF